MYRNPAHLLSLDGEPARRLLRACGTEEDLLLRGSDYDRFVALAAVMPLCEGHPLAEAMTDTLQAATGLCVPLCPHTAADYWRRWTDIHWYGKSPTPPETAASCPLCAAPSPRRISRRDVIDLSDPRLWTGEDAAEDLAGLSRRVQDVLSAGRPYIRVCLPTDFAFVRPDPYHAAGALRAVTEARATEADRALLIAQALRVLGEQLRGCTETVLLQGGRGDAVVALLAYLWDCDRLPALVWLPDDPADAAAVSGLYAAVSTGYAVAANDPAEAISAKQAAYRQAAPIGRAYIYTET